MRSVLSITADMKSHVSDGKMPKGVVEDKRRLSWTDRRLRLKRESILPESNIAEPSPFQIHYSTTKNTHTLPSELTDTIIDYLYDDKEALAACSLVCRSWVPGSRYHLFCSITVVADSHLAFGPFICFLESVGEAVSYIKELNLWGQRLEKLSVGGPLDKQPVVCYHTLTAIIAKLPALCDLTIRWIRFAHMAHYRPSKSAKVLGKVIRTERLKRRMTEIPACDSYVATPPLELLPLNKLELWSSGSPNYPINDLLSMFTLFSEVKLLTTFNCSIDDSSLHGVSSEEFSSALSPHFRVHATNVQWSSPSLLSILRQSPSTDCLSVVSVGCGTWEDITSVGSLLRDVGSTLLHLMFDHANLIISSGSVDANEWSMLSLSSCTKLESVRLIIGMDRLLTPSPSFYTQLCTSTLDVLAFIPSSVTEIIFQVLLLAPEHAMDEFDKIMDWERMEALLVRQENLNSVQFIWAARTEPKPQADLVPIEGAPVPLKARLPRVYEKLSLQDMED